MAGFTLNIPTVDGDIRKVEDYLYRLDKQLRYMFSNIDPEDNYSAAALLKSADANNRIEVNEKAIIAEAKRASDAEGELSARITINAEAITAEVTRAETAEGNLSTRITLTEASITAEVQRASEAEGDLSSRITVNAEAIAAEVSRAGTAEGNLSSRITQTAEAITSEVTRATEAESGLSSGISGEITRATNAESALSTRITQTADAITAEVTRASGAEADLSSRITVNADAITSEASRAATAEGALSTMVTQNATAISSEATRAETAEGALSTRITQNATAISSEVTRAGTAEGNLSSRITQNANDITLKVSTDSLVSSMNSQLQLTGNSINLTTGHFTIDSTNFKVNASGDVNITGEMEAYKFVSTAGGVKVYAEGDGSSYIEIDSVIAHYDPLSHETTYSETTIGKWDGSGLSAGNYHIQQSETEMYYWQESWWDHYGDMRIHDISFINLDYTLDPEQPDKERELKKTLRQYLFDFEDRITALERR